MAQLILDLTGRGGLTDRYFGDAPYTASKPNLRYLGGDSQMAEGIYNPLVLNGYLYPANNTTKAISGTTSFLLTSALVMPQRLSTTDNIFFADEAVTGTTGKIQNLDSAVDTSLDQAYEIPLFDTNQYSKCVDMIRYSVNNNAKIFFLKMGTTGGTGSTVAIAEADFSSPDPDWLETVPTGAFSNLSTNSRSFFVLGDNNILYVMNADAIHAIDGSVTGGANGTAYEDAIVFDQGTRLIDGMNYRGKIWVGLHINANLTIQGSSDALSGKSVEQFVGVYIWDKRTTIASTQDFIRIPGAKAFRSMHMISGLPMCFTQSTEGYTQIRIWNGREMQLAKTLGKSAYPNFRRHSVYEGGDYIIWLGADGYVYLYGKVEGSQTNGLYIIGDMTSHVTGGQTYSTSGVLVPANATETVTSGTQAESLAFYISFSDGAGNHLKKWYPNSVGTIASNAQISHIGNVYSLAKPLPHLSTVKTVVIRCAPTSTGSTTIATIKYYFNNSSTVGMTKTVTMTEASKGYISHDLNKQNVTSIQIEVEWSVATTRGADDFAPYVATVEYEPTKTHSPSAD